MYDEETQNHTHNTDSQTNSLPPCFYIGQLVGAFDDFQGAILGAAQVGVDLQRTLTVTNIEYDNFAGYGVWCPIAWDFDSIEQAEIALSLLKTGSGDYIRLFEGSISGEGGA